MSTLIGTPIPSWIIQLTAVVAILAPLLAFQANLGRAGRFGLLGLFSPRVEPRWRLEFYAASGPIEGLLAPESEMPFPVKRVRSARGDIAAVSSIVDSWMLPQVELDITASDPWASEVLQGMFVSHRVRFVSGDEALVEASTDGQDTPVSVRIRAVPHRG